MSDKQKGGGKKGGVAKKKARKPAKKPSTFKEFWKKLVKKKDVPTERMVKRAVNRVARNMHLKKDERQQVASVLAAEVHRRAQEKKFTVAEMSQLKPGATAFPIAVQEGLAPDSSQSDQEPGYQIDPAALESAKKSAVSDLEAQRKSFMAKHGSAEGASISASLSKSYRPEDYGSQPSTLAVENNAVREIASHSVVRMLQDLLLESATTSRREAPSTKSTKEPEDMTPDELVELRKRDPKMWDDHVKKNTLVSFALTKPKDEELKSAKKRAEKTKSGKPLQFEDRVEVNMVPVGKDFYHNEKKTSESGTLKRK